MANLSYSHLLHSLKTGPIEQYTIKVDTDSLKGVDLDFAYAIATGEYEDIVLEFSPGELPERVRVSTAGGLAGFISNKAPEEMRQLVKSNLGDNFDAVRLKKS